MATYDPIRINRPTGEFIINVDDDSVTRKEAHRKCAGYGAILAPITEKSDLDAILEVLLRDTEDERRWKFYHVGLEVARDNSSRIFNNGVKFDSHKHGAFYKEFHGSLEDHECLTSYIVAWNETLAGVYVDAVRCVASYQNFVCLKPKNSNCYSAGALAEENSLKYEKSMQAMYVVGTGLFCMTVVAALLALTFRKRLQRPQRFTEQTPRA